MGTHLVLLTKDLFCSGGMRDQEFSILTVKLTETLWLSEFPKIESSGKIGSSTWGKLVFSVPKDEFY